MGPNEEAVWRGRELRAQAANIAARILKDKAARVVSTSPYTARVDYEESQAMRQLTTAIYTYITTGEWD